MEAVSGSFVRHCHVMIVLYTYVDPGQFGMKFSSHGGTGTGIRLKPSEFVLYFVVLLDDNNSNALYALVIV